MPLIKKKLSKEQKKLVEQKIILGQERPDDIFDLVDCGLHQVPDGVFSYCNVLQKNALLLRGNKLHDLKGGGQLADLSNIMILDLSHNSFSTLTKDITCLRNLQKLDLSFNKIKKLPEELGDCLMLNHLSVEGNRLSSFISNVKNLQRLKSLNIAKNEDISHLPIDICFLQNLQTLDFELNNIRYPPSEVTALGLNEIRRWLRLVVGDEYDTQMMEIKEKQAALGNCIVDMCETEDSSSAVELSRNREALALKKQRELEQRILQSEMEDRLLLESVAKERDEMSNRVQMQELRDQEELSKAYHHSEQSRRLEFEAWLKAEDLSACETIQLVLQMSERSRNAEAVLEELERDREHLDQLFKISQEESEKLRKQEVIESMSYVLEELQRHNTAWETYQSRKCETEKMALRACSENDDALDRELQGQASLRADLASKILNEEEAQMEAFQAVQFQQDAILSRIRAQVELVEAELLQITKQEIDRRQQDEHEEMSRLSEMRTNTAMMLSKLMDEKEHRVEELNRRLGEMEAQRDDDEKDYWLVQFQRLLDNKPQSLKDEEFLLDERVVDVLVEADVSNYRPLFARRRVTWEMMQSASNDTLREMGVANAEARTKILKTIGLSAKMLEKKSPETSQRHVISTDVTAKQERECVVCLEKPPDMIILMCGHVCTCADCCQPLTDCPICRQPISQKCRLYNV